MGVAVPLRNPSFRLPTSWNGLLSAGVASGNKVFVVDSGDPGDPVNFLSPGDKAYIGPSGDADNEGQTESFVVSSVAANQITTVDNSTIDFADNDAISAIGNLCSGGWIPSNIDTLYDIEVIGGGYGGAIGSGYLDNYRLKFDQNTDGGRINQAINKKWFLVGQYRGGVFAKAATVGAADSVRFRVSNGTSEFMNFNIINAVLTAWTPVDSFAGSAVVGSGSPYIRFYYRRSGGESAGLQLDDVFLEHALGTDGAAAGAYTFDWDPESESIQINAIDGMQSHRLPVNTTRFFSPADLGDRTPRWSISASFSQVSQTFYDNLRQFKYWQNKGWLLNLHTGLKDIPPTLTGRMTLSSIRKNQWDLAYGDFELTFVSE